MRHSRVQKKVASGWPLQNTTLIKDICQPYPIQMHKGKSWRASLLATKIVIKFWVDSSTLNRIQHFVIQNPK